MTSTPANPSEGGAIIVHRGFQNLAWYCAPDSWKPHDDDGTREGRDGNYTLTNDGNVLTIYPPAKKDFWQKTYYEPELVKDDGPILYKSLKNDSSHYTITTRFSLVAVEQFDQAGICVRFDSHHWIKTGIEVVDNVPHLSCVVTNAGYSDWSTQVWNSYTQQMSEKGSKIINVDRLDLRVHCRGNSFVVEAKIDDKNDWHFIRIAHIATTSSSLMKAGVFSCCPQDQTGGHAVFDSFSIELGSQMEHNADGNH